MYVKNVLLYRIGLPSNTATLLALFVRIELLKISSFSYDTLLLYSNFGSPISVSTNVIENNISVV